ncbi:c-type cytochrome [Algiphilus sp.]|uniref:c-type cytochrome n=1 Tax=Algiphilus sp. TaxID=1872431 RepID=UPI0025BD6058|nr:cytochrome c [Algiphilus sp.]MCK5770533.1 cytochrome c [Algiphilus sp.]
MRKTLALLLLCAAAGASAEDRSLQELVATCAACHGESGNKTIQPSYPLLAGQHADYLAAALEQYRSGARKNAVMNGQAANLSDREIKALARYYSRQESVVYTPAYSAETAGTP